MVVTQHDARWRAFGAIALTYITIVFASTMSFLVLTSISDEFDVTLAAVSWVVITESLIVAALLLPLGNLGDRLGRRRVLASGMALFGVGCALTGLAPTFSLVIAARVVTSLGNALVQSIGTGLLVASFPSEERGLAMGAQTTAVSVGSATGPILTGLLLDVLSWRVIFALLAVPSAIAVAMVIVLIPRDEPTGSHRRSGLASVVLSIAAITVMTITINNPFEWSWQSWPIAAGGLFTVALAAGYIRAELTSPTPMLDLRLFTIGAFRTATLVRWVGFTAATAMTLLMPIMLLSVLQLSGRLTGLILSTLAVGMGIAAQVAGRVYDHVGPRLPTMVGLTLQGSVFLALSFVDADTAWGLIMVASFLQGLAMGSWNVPNGSAMLGATPPDALGVGGAFTNVTRTLGNVVGQALAAAIVVAVLRNQGFDIPLGEIEDTPSAAASFVDGWQLAFWVASAMTFGLAVIAARLGWAGERTARVVTPERALPR